MSNGIGADVFGRPVQRTRGEAHPDRPTPSVAELPPHLFATRLDRDARLIWVAAGLLLGPAEEMGPFDADAFEVRKPAPEAA